MIHSMTAFARLESQHEKGSLVCEIRSINHRYLEISLYLPDVLRVLEMPVRDAIRQFVKRGKIECAVRFQPRPETVVDFSINMQLAEALCEASEKIAGYLQSPGTISPSDILRFPGVMETQEVDAASLQKELLALIEKTMDELRTARHREGEGLKQLFLERLDLIQKELLKVREQLPQVMKDQHNRLLKRFAEAKLELDPVRLEQEMVMFANKIDVSEELDRTETHILEIRRILKEGGLVGRRLDFLLQELNREANTLGSKSVDPVITHSAVEMKVLIEQVREQVQNVE